MRDNLLLLVLLVFVVTGAGCSFFADVEAPDLGVGPAQDMRPGVDLGDQGTDQRDLSPGDMPRDTGPDIPCEPSMSCEGHGAECGFLDNGCGSTLNCGNCAGENDLCLNNTCICVAEGSTELCMTANRECGDLSAMTRCGMDKTVDCGKCRGNEDCIDGSCVRR